MHQAFTVRKKLKTSGMSSCLPAVQVDELIGALTAEIGQCCDAEHIQGLKAMASTQAYLCQPVCTGKDGQYGSPEDKVP